MAGDIFHHTSLLIVLNNLALNPAKAGVLTTSLGNLLYKSRL